MQYNEVIFQSESYVECDFFISKLRSQISLRDYPRRLAPIKEKENYINKIIKHHSIKISFIKETRIEYLNTKLEKSDLEFIRNGEDRFINWLWIYILKNNRDLYSSKHGKTQYREHVKENHITPELDGTNNKKEGLVQFIQDVNSTRDEKKNKIDEFKKRWLQAQQELTSIKWIHKDDEDQINFIWETYRKKEGSLPISPTSINEKYHAFIGVIDSWTDLDNREVFLHKLKKNWNQRKQRRNDDGRVAIQYRIREEVKKKLVSLAHLNDLHISETLERLIEKAHKEKLILRRIDTNPQFEGIVQKED